METDRLLCLLAGFLVPGSLEKPHGIVGCRMKGEGGGERGVGESIRSKTTTNIQRFSTDVPHPYRLSDQSQREQTAKIVSYTLKNTKQLFSQTGIQNAKQRKNRRGNRQSHSRPRLLFVLSLGFVRRLLWREVHRDGWQLVLPFHCTSIRSPRVRRRVSFVAYRSWTTNQADKRRPETCHRGGSMQTQQPDSWSRIFSHDSSRSPPHSATDNFFLSEEKPVSLSCAQYKGPLDPPRFNACIR